MTKTVRPVANEIIATLLALRNPVRGEFLQRFFKTGKGEYGEGDIFLGLSVPQVRKIVKTYRQGVQLEDISILLKHEGHEIRLAAVLLLAELFKKDPTPVFEFYLANTQGINNWDIVDSSASQIVGEYILANPTHQPRITALLNSSNIWERRIALIAMFPLIREKDFELPLLHLTTLLYDKQYLIQTAVGWALRRIGDQEPTVLAEFLTKYAATMPRVSLRYAIEHLDQVTRKQYLQLKNTKE